MSNRAKELLQKHRQLLSRESVLVAHLDSLNEMLNDEPETVIEELALGRRLDGMPSSGNLGSQTEYIALNYGAVAKAEASAIRAAIAQAAKELRQVRIEISLYNAVLKSLSEVEARFVQLHYDETLSINRISEISLTPDAQTMYSPSTLKRLNTAILNKVDVALGPRPPGTGVHT